MRTLIWKRNLKVHDMKTKKRPIWMKIGSFWPPNLRRWINFLKVCVNYSVSWYTYKDILFNHHPYPESWESIPYISFTWKLYPQEQYNIRSWFGHFATKTLLSVYEFFSVHSSSLMFVYDAIFGTLDSYKKAIQFWHQKYFCE